MPRDAEEARNRLQRAALELFAENGFDHTTAAQIAARAGVTERTFFRHFPDKREVLFDGQNILGAALSDAIAKAPPDLPPLRPCSGLSRRLRRCWNKIASSPNRASASLR